MDPISINLAGGHYLKVGIALQATIDAHEAPEGSHAQDLAVVLLSGRTRGGAGRRAPPGRPSRPS